MRKKTLAAVAAVVVAAVALTACGSSSDDDSSSSNATGSGGASSASGGGTAAPSTVKLGFCSGLTMTFMPYLVAKADGDLAAIEKKFHTKFQEITDLAGPTCVPAFTSGSIDFFGSTLSNTVLVKSQGKDAKAVLEPFYGSALFFIGDKKYKASRGTDPSKYDGAKVAGSAPGAPISTWIKTIGSNNNAKYTEVDLGSPAAFTPAMKAGRVDAFVGEITSATTALSTNAGYLIKNLNTPDIEKYVGHFYSSGNFSTTNAFTSKYPDLTQAFVEAQIKALDKIQKVADDPAAVKALLPADFASKQTDWNTTWELIKPCFVNAFGAVTQAQFDDSAKQFNQFGPLKPGATSPGSAVDNSFVIKAYQDLGLTPPQQLPATVNDAKGG